MTPESFRQKRRELYAAADWDAYEELVCWDQANQDKAFKKSLSLVARALNVERGTIIMSALTHGQKMETLSAMTDSLAD